MPKVKKPIRAAALRATKAARHDPLGQVVLDDANKKKYAKVSGRRTKGDKKKDRRAQTAGAAEDDEERHLLDEKASNRILELSQAQQLEMEAEEEIERRRRRKQQNVQKFQDSDDEDDDNEEDSALLDDEDEQALVVKDVSGGYVTLAEDGFGLSPEDEALIASMMQPSEERRTLADIILEKIEEKEADTDFHNYAPCVSTLHYHGTILTVATVHGLAFLLESLHSKQFSSNFRRNLGMKMLAHDLS